MLKPNKICLRCKQIAIISEKISQEKSEKLVWSFKTLNKTSPAKERFIYFFVIIL